MVDPIDWEALCGEYRVYRSEASGKSARRFEASPAAVDRLADPTDDDSRWLIDALKDATRTSESRKWFVVDLFRRSDSWSAVFFSGLLDAAIDEVNPSLNRYLVEPCMKRFGARPVNEFLLAVVESGTDSRQAGAVNALYRAKVPLAFPGDAPSFDIEHATRDSRAMYESLQDIWERRKRLFLETFVDIRHRVEVQLGERTEMAPLPHRNPSA